MELGLGSYRKARSVIRTGKVPVGTPRGKPLPANMRRSPIVVIENFAAPQYTLPPKTGFFVKSYVFAASLIQDPPLPPGPLTCWYARGSQTYTNPFLGAAAVTAL